MSTSGQKPLRTTTPVHALPNVVEGGWSGGLARELERIARVATGCGEIRLLRGGPRLAVGLPLDPDAARVVLDLYHPHRLSGRLFRLFGISLLKSRLYRRVLFCFDGVSDAPEVAWLREVADEGQIGFFGCNPSHGLRCIVGGISGDRDAMPFVGKLGFDDSRDAIIREGTVLEQLAGRHAGILRPLSLDTGEDWALLRLPHLGFRAPRNMVDPKVMELLLEWLGGSILPLGESDWASDLLRRAEAAGIDPAWCQSMRSRKVQKAVVHGDFAVWNLRLLPSGPCAIDWEWAVEDGVAGVDLAYGLHQEAVMLCRLNPVRTVRRILAQARSRSFAAYLEACGWGDNHEDWLRFGLLHSHLNTGSNSRETLGILGLNMGAP